jgi:Xaa-Pro aminopeptidase
MPALTLNNSGKILIILERERLDGILVSHQPNITYLSNSPSSDSYLLLTPKQSFFITDSRYYQQARLSLNPVRKKSSNTLTGTRGKKLSNGVRGFNIKLIGESVFNTIAHLTLDAKIKRLGFEARNLDVAQYQKIKKLIHPVRFISTQGLIEEFRELKEAGEIAKIKKAVKIAAKALSYARRIIRPGLREIEIAAELERFIRYNGGRATSFETIVASGKNSSFPHHLTCNRKIKRGESLFIDIGVDYQGYKSDLTRTFFLGKIPSGISKIYDIVRQAQIQAINRVKPGMKICQIDKCARQHIAKEGYGGFFTHSLGHGIGLEVHEFPFISANNKTALETGMTFTVEPGIYLPNKFGIRIEDDVLVTKTGCEVLSAGLDK